jgi:A/G-specific adenine glycosylase
MKIARFQQALAAWYEAHGRKTLPWRNTRDPYAIWISETMLQQTQVKTVLERFYTPFLTLFPTIESLAAAPREDVLSAWAGLGYYRRAANLHEAAIRIQDLGFRIQGKPSLPQDVASLLSLPGIGRNTANAIASFAYGVPVPVMEANVKRVLCRVYALTTPNDATLWQHAETLAKAADIFIHNQAMMDLGAMICTPKAPRCAACPVAEQCQGKQTPEQFPTKIKAKAVPVKQRNILMVEHGGLIYAEPREGNHLGGLYRFLETESNRVTINGLAFDLRALPHQRLTHHYSHYTLEAKVYRLALPPTFQRLSNHWWSAAALAKLPMSNLEKKALS